MIRVENLTRNYGDLRAVDDVSLSVARGEIVGLLGHNGAGKTTIMKVLTGFLEPTDGKVIIDGVDIRENLEAVQRKIGYLPENCPVYPEMTVIDYLDYTAALHGVPPSERGSAMREAIAHTELHDKGAEVIGTLSRGYRQRVGVAQAILHHPRILILDEPTNGLDPTQIQHMRGLIRSLAESATVILSTHILQEVQAICDRVVIIRSGEKVLDARLDDLRAGSRLLLATDAEPQRLRPLLSGLEGVGTVEELTPEGGHHRYALGTENGGEPTAIAPSVARTMVKNGLALYSLMPESRDVESIFGEISAQEGRPLQ